MTACDSKRPSCDLGGTPHPHPNENSVGAGWSLVELAVTGGGRATVDAVRRKPIGQFSVHVLLQVASALEKDVNYFLPEESRVDPKSGASDDVIDQIAQLISHSRRRVPP